MNLCDIGLLAPLTPSTYSRVGVLDKWRDVREDFVMLRQKWIEPAVSRGTLQICDQKINQKYVIFISDYPSIVCFFFFSFHSMFYFGSVFIKPLYPLSIANFEAWFSFSPEFQVSFFYYYFLVFFFLYIHSGIFHPLVDLKTYSILFVIKKNQEIDGWNE